MCAHNKEQWGQNELRKSGNCRCKLARKVYGNIFQGWHCHTALIRKPQESTGDILQGSNIRWLYTDWGTDVHTCGHALIQFTKAAARHGSHQGPPVKCTLYEVQIVVETDMVLKIVNHRGTHYLCKYNVLIQSLQTHNESHLQLIIH